MKAQLGGKEGGRKEGIHKSVSELNRDSNEVWGTSPPAKRKNRKNRREVKMLSCWDMEARGLKEKMKLQGHCAFWDARGGP